MILAASEAGATDAPPLLLLHGLFGQARNFATVQRRLAERYRVIALDLRNHGRSPHAAGMDYLTLAVDVAETMAALRVAAGVLVGHSMGGKAAMALALTRPALVRRLVVVDIAPVAYRHANLALINAMRSLPLDAALARGEADRMLAPAVPDRVVRGFLLQNFEPGPAPRWRIGLEELAEGIAALEGWDVPAGLRYGGEALLIRGGASAYVGEPEAAAFLARFTAGRIATVAGAAPWVHAGAPERFIALVEPGLASG